MLTTYIILFGLLGLIYAIYRFGEKEGTRKMTKKQISMGAWVEIIKPIKFKKYRESKNFKIPKGTLAFVLRKTKSNTFTLQSKKNKTYIDIWVPNPLPRNLNKNIFRISEFAKIKIIPESKVSENIKEDTMKDVELQIGLNTDNPK